MYIYMCAVWFNIIYTERDNSLQRQTNDDNETRDQSRRVYLCN